MADKEALRQDGAMDFFGSHLVILVLVLGLMALFVVALVSIGGAAATGTEKAVWVLITLLFPLIGPIVWFAVGRRGAGKPSGSF